MSEFIWSVTSSVLSTCFMFKTLRHRNIFYFQKFKVLYSFIRNVQHFIFFYKKSGHLTGVFKQLVYIAKFEISFNLHLNTITFIHCNIWSCIYKCYLVLNWSIKSSPVWQARTARMVSSCEWSPRMTTPRWRPTPHTDPSRSSPCSPRPNTTGQHA